MELGVKPLCFTVALAAMLVGCDKPDDNSEAQALRERERAEIYAEEKADQERAETGIKDALLLSDQQIMKLISDCKSKVYDVALHASSSGGIAMVEPESAAKFILAAGDLAIAPFDRRVKAARYLESKGTLFLNTQFAIISGNRAGGQNIDIYECKLEPGAVLGQVVKWKSEYLP